MKFYCKKCNKFIKKLDMRLSENKQEELPEHCKKHDSDRIAVVERLKHTRSLF